MIAAVAFGAAVAILLFGVRLLLPAKAGLWYDRAVLSAFRLAGLICLATVAAIAFYALIVAR